MIIFVLILSLFSALSCSASNSNGLSSHYLELRNNLLMAQHALEIVQNTIDSAQVLLQEPKNPTRYKLMMGDIKELSSKYSRKNLKTFWLDFKAQTVRVCNLSPRFASSDVPQDPKDIQSFVFFLLSHLKEPLNDSFFNFDYHLHQLALMKELITSMLNSTEELKRQAHHSAQTNWPNDDYLEFEQVSDEVASALRQLQKFVKFNDDLYFWNLGIYRRRSRISRLIERIKPFITQCKVDDNSECITDDPPPYSAINSTTSEIKEIEEWAGMNLCGNKKELQASS